MPVLGPGWEIDNFFLTEQLKKVCYRFIVVYRLKPEVRREV